MKDVAEFVLPSQGDVHLDLRTLLRGAVRVALEATLEEEMRLIVGAGRWARIGDRIDVRNGSYLRKIVTGMGQVEVAVPRSREHGSAGDVLGRYQRRSDEIDNAMVAAYVNGISTRKMSSVTEALLDESVGRTTVSRVTRTLEQQVDALRKAPIPAAMPYLYLDATFINTRWARKVENVSVLVAYGVDTSGHRCLLAVTMGAQESQESWTDLLRQLVDRGLHGVDLVIADAHGGLAAAVRHLLPEAKQQRCVVHLNRNVFTKAPQRLRGRVAREVGLIFKAPSLAEARRGLEQFRERLGKQVPESLECLEAGFAAATQFYAFPRAHWKKIRSTNGMERLHVEIKRRTRAVGAFPDRTSALRLIVAVVLRATAVWKSRHYLAGFEPGKPKELQQAA